MTGNVDLWAAAVAVAGQALLITDDEGRVTTANQAALDLLDAGDDLAGQSLQDLLSARPVISSFVTPFRQGDRIWQSVVLQDDSIAREAAENLAIRLKADSFGELAANIAHEFNNHLGGASGFAQLALTSLDDPERVRTCLEEVVEATDAGARQIASIMIFGQRQLFEPETITVGQHVADCEGLIRSLLPPGIELGMDIEDQESKAILSPGKMAESILEMCENALTAMADQPSGQLGVRLVRREMTAADLRTFYDMEPGPYLSLSISDTGCGMTEETRRHLFDPLYTTHDIGEKGGLGMSVVYSIFTRSGGMLDVASTPGEGTTITAWLPVIE